MALILAIDVSGSVNEERFSLQRAGYASAFVNPDVIEAVTAGSTGAIAVTLVEWSGKSHQRQVIGWTLISDGDSARALSEAVSAMPRVFADWTSISGAVDFAVGLLRQLPHEAKRQIIDISGDGPNNDGRPAEAARDEAVASGITINGLPILTLEPELDVYYREHVVGGADAFVVAVHDFGAFAHAIQEKLIREIVEDRLLRSSPLAAQLDEREHSQNACDLD